MTLYRKREGAYAGSLWRPTGMEKDGKAVLEAVAIPGLLHIFSMSQMEEAISDAAVRMSFALASQEFHELCMDYRGAPVLQAPAAFERLQEFILAAAALALLP